jgi:hypothetical protein
MILFLQSVSVKDNRKILLGKRGGCAAQKFRLASKLTDTMGQTGKQPFNLLYARSW